MEQEARGTTIVAVRKGDRVAVAGDGQVTFGNTILKSQAKKVRKIFKDGVVVGFAGASADAFTLLIRLEEKLESYGGNLSRAAVELARDWRTDKVLRRLEAFMIAADREKTFLISGTGDVIEPDEGVVAIGSGGPYALAAAKALIAYTDLAPKEVALESLRIASEICIYTNRETVVEEL
jgi:ATP-dependent HslUV protease subunit HslV